MSPINLVWIVPVCVAIGMWLAALFGVNRI